MSRTRTSRPLAFAGIGLCLLAIAIVLLISRRPGERGGASGGRDGARAGATTPGADAAKPAPARGGSEAVESPARDESPPEGSLRLEGHVKFPDGSPVTGANVSLDTQEHMYARLGKSKPSAITAADGAFAIAGLAPELYQVSVERAGVAHTVFQGIRVEREDLPPIELVVERGAVLAGKVVGDDGQGVGDVDVTAFAWSAPPGVDINDLPGATARTDGTGAFRFDTLHRLPYRLLTQPNDPFARSSGAEAWAPDREDVILRLERGAIIEGRVIDGSTGRGIEGAQVSFESRATEDGHGGSSGGGIPTGPDGRFRLCLEAPCSATLSVARDGYGSVEPLLWDRLEPGEVVEPLEFRLEQTAPAERSPPPVVAGTVLDAGGRPVPAARVVLGDAGQCVGWEGGNFYRSQEADLTATTSADGTFRIQLEEVKRGESRFLRAEHPEAGVASPVEVAIGGQESDLTGIRLSLGPPGGIAGVVMGPGGPVAGARVELERFHARCGARSDRLESEDSWSRPVAAVTGPDGRFEFPLLEEAPARVRAAGPRPFLPAPARLIEVAPGATAEVEIVLKEGRSISGTVVAAGGTPIRGAHVGASKDEEGSPDSGGQSTITDQDGFYRIDRLAPGMYRVSAWAEGFLGEERRDVEAGSAGVDFVFDAPAEIEVAASDAAGGGRIRWVTLRLVPVATGASGTETTEEVSAGQAATVRPGTWAVEVAARGYLTRRLPDPVRIRPGERARLEVALEPGLSIAGSVVDGDGEPVHGARVAFRPASLPAAEPKSRGRSETVVFTDEKGAFQAAGFAEGAYRVNVYHAGVGETTLRVRLAAPGRDGAASGPDGEAPGQGGETHGAAALRRIVLKAR